MLETFRRAVLALVAAGAMPLPALAQQMDQLSIMAPAAPGGGWDGTARVMQDVPRRLGSSRW